MCPRSSSTGTVSVNVPSPVSLSTSVTFSPTARCSQNSLMPPANLNSAGRGADRDGQAGHQVGGLPGPLDHAVVAERGVAQEHLPVRPEPDASPGLGLGNPRGLAEPRLPAEVGVRPARLGELAGDPAAEAGRPGVAAPVHLDVQPRGQRVHHGRADPVQAAGGGVGAAAELAARVQPGHDELDAGQLGLALVVDGDAAAVVPDLGGSVGVQDDLYPGAVTGECLIYRVVEDLPEAEE